MNLIYFFSALPFSLSGNFLIISFFFLLIANEASCKDPQYLACKAETCGDGQEISFPFYIPDKQQPFCGYPGFNLSCNTNGSPVLKLSNNEYIIQGISYQNQSLIVSNAAVFDKNISARCIPLVINNMSLPHDGAFKLSSNRARSLFLFYNCNPAILSKSNYKVDCLGNGTETSTVAMLDDDPLLNDASKGCEREVLTPVDSRLGGIVGIQEMLERGFELSWTASNCSDCEDSGGKCGFDYAAYNFKCFCTDRPHSWRCSSEKKKSKITLLLGLAASAAGIGVLMIVLCYFWRKSSSINLILCGNRKSRGNQSIEIFLRNYGPLAPKRYSYSEVKKMTDCFKNKLGQGGYGGVFKGELSDGCLVAVKVLKESNSNGEEFINEVASIGRTSHVNIVTLLGFCIEGSKRALVYEFMPNGSLDKHIYEDHRLGWETLHQIAVGIARGLEYLHKGCNTRILHLDIKPQNILLDGKFHPKISDFGLSKICPGRESIISMLGARGTAGYIAPEVFCRNFGGVSHKSDVYSYGMLVLEIVGWRKKITVGIDKSSEIYFPDCIYKSLELGQELGLSGISNEEENQTARKMTFVSLWCIQTDPSNRPSMSRAVEMLQGDMESLPVPPRPYLSSPSRYEPKLVVDSSTGTLDASE